MPSPPTSPRLQRLAVTAYGCVDKTRGLTVLAYGFVNKTLRPMARQETGSMLCLPRWRRHSKASRLSCGPSKYRRKPNSRYVARILQQIYQGAILYLRRENSPATKIRAALQGPASADYQFRWICSVTGHCGDTEDPPLSVAGLQR